jgi:LDH2 family malate/lactate/ureidoglycolate dehydrogenase
MPNIPADELNSLVKRMLIAAGADDENAGRVAEALVLSDLSGVSTHGVHQMPGYIKSINDGEIVPTARPETVRETPTTALVTGNWGFGFAAALLAIEVAVDKAERQGVAVVSLVEVNHIGRLGEYSEIAASRGMVCMVWASGYGAEVPYAAPYGGSEPVLHTNPISIGVPAGDEPSMVLDFATTVVSGSRVTVSLREGKQLPPGAIADSQGRATSDPDAFFEGGALLPFGGHKGYAIMLADELLGRVLSGADAYADTDRGGPGMRHQGVTFIVFKADLFQPMAEFTRTSDELLRKVRAVPPAPGFDRVLVPGDPETNARAHGRRHGIPLTDKLWQSLTELAEELGVPVG